MTKLSESIVGKIKVDHIAPVSKWHFLLRGYIFWSLFGISVFLGSLSFGVIVHLANSGDLDILRHLKGNLVTSAVMLLPYFWLLFVLMFTIVAYVNWKYTKLGYRFRRRWILLGSVAVSIFFGSIFYALGMAKKVDNLMAKNVPIYSQSKHAALRELWFQPENGLLTGKIVKVDEATEQLIIIDETGRNWSVDDDGANWENMQLEKKGKTVKMIGKKDGENNFRAKEIRRCGDCQDDEQENDEKKENGDSDDDDDDDEENKDEDENEDDEDKDNDE